MRPLYDEEVSVRVEAVRCAALLGSLDLAHFAMDDEAPPVRRRVLAALAEDGAFETGVLRDAATALRRRFSLAVSLMKALEDVSLEENVLLGVAAKLRGTNFWTGSGCANTLFLRRRRSRALLGRPTK